MPQNILICGATGFVGRNMVEQLAANPDYIIHAVRYNRPEYTVPHAKNPVVWHQADLRDPAACETLCKGMDIIIQAAATTSGAKDIVSRPFIHTTDNAVMNSYLIRAAFENAVKHFIFFSCTVMYQSSDVSLKETDFDESNPLHPRYFGVGNTKIYIEKMCEFYAGLKRSEDFGGGQMKCTAIRHSNIYGNHDKFDLERSHVFGATITKAMLAQTELVVWGTGEEERDVLHADDLVRFVDAAIQKQPAPYRLYNCGAGQAVSIKNLVHKIVAATGKQLEIKHDTTMPTIKTSLFLNCSLAESELGWTPQVNLEDGIARTIAWWRENIDPVSLKTAA